MFIREPCLVGRPTDILKNWYVPFLYILWTLLPVFSLPVHSIRLDLCAENMVQVFWRDDRNASLIDVASIVVVHLRHEFTICTPKYIDLCSV